MSKGQCLTHELSSRKYEITEEQLQLLSGYQWLADRCLWNNPATFSAAPIIPIFRNISAPDESPE